MSARTTNGRLLSVVDVADRLGVNRQTVHRMIVRREIEWIDIAVAEKTKHPRPRIRISESAIEAWLHRRTHRAAA